MKIFHCNHCDQLLFFENTTCLGCGRPVAYLPDVSLMSSLDPLPDGNWRSPIPKAGNTTYRLCGNYTNEQICNWAIPSSDAQSLCLSCRLTRAIPDLSQDGHRQAWYRLEVAKRRVLYTLLQLELPLRGVKEDPAHGLTFEFKGDVGEGVLTGHANGVITVNVAEADDVERERQKKAVHEPYRTIVGHMRHEVGHYYWERLINANAEIDTFREMFGDERKDYAAALQAHYEQGAGPNWQDNFVSAYASSHPWEDWAETWAHYLNMVDALETAAACGLSLRPRHPDEPSMPKVPSTVPPCQLEFSSLVDNWFPLTYALNNLNRGLGLPDAYPFVLSTPVIAKLQYVHDVIRRGGNRM